MVMVMAIATVVEVAVVMETWGLGDLAMAMAMAMTMAIAKGTGTGIWIRIAVPGFPNLAQLIFGNSREMEDMEYAIETIHRRVPDKVERHSCKTSNPCVHETDVAMLYESWFPHKHS